MFVRRKKNRSGSTSVVVADKSFGRFTELHVIGVGTTEDEIRQLVNEGKTWIAHYGGQQTISFPDDECEKLRREENSMTEYIVSNIISTSLNSPQRIINKVYDKIGFNIIQDEELRHLVVSRICSPMSKKATVDYLRRYFREEVSLQKIYRYLDKLYESGRIMKKIIATERRCGVFNDIKYPDGDRLIVGYSDERAKKNAFDREQGVERLRKRFSKGTLTKADINKRGYNKFLSVSSGITVSIDEEKIKEDAIWDGLKGYKTNTDLSPEKVYEAYQNLWNVERSFRITKGTLDVRPMFHFTPRRIEAHVCICFVALKVYKELERLLKLSGCPYSVDETLKIAETIVTIEIARPENKDTITKTLCLTEEERAIAYLIDTHDWLEL